MPLRHVVAKVTGFAERRHDALVTLDQIPGSLTVEAEPEDVCDTLRGAHHGGQAVEITFDPDRGTIVDAIVRDG